MKLTALSIALVAALGMTAGCSTQTTMSQASRPGSTLADAEAQYALGRYYQGQQRYELAIDSYRRALAAYPTHIGAYNGLGASLLLSGHAAEAIEQFKAGLQHQPRSAALWNNLGYAYALSGENKLAEIAYRQSLDLDPTDYKTNTNLAMVQQGSPQAAAEPVVNAPVATTASAPVTPPQSAPVQQPVAAQSVAVAAAAPVMAAKPSAEPAKPVPAEPASPAMSPQPIAEAAEATMPATMVQVAKVAPRVYELNLADTRIATAPAVATAPASMPASEATRISVPLRQEVVQTASINNDDFVLEIRNGNGIRRMAWRTSQYLAEQGYTTKRLTNQPGFNVKVTRIFYLPGYIEEATRLLAHLPKDSVLTETSNLRRGTHIRVVLGKDMVEQQASWDAKASKLQLAALQQ